MKDSATIKKASFISPLGDERDNGFNLPVENGDSHTLDFNKASERLKKIVHKTPLTYNHHLSKKHQCNIFLKKADFYRSCAHTSFADHIKYD